MAPYKISYRILHQYPDSELGITIPVVLTVGEQIVKISDAKADIGASHCVFERGFGELLGLEIEKGTLKRFSTVTGQFTAYGHWVSMFVLGISFDTEVFFADVRRNVLGRHGWFNKLRIGLVDYDHKLYVSGYDDPEE